MSKSRGGWTRQVPIAERRIAANLPLRLGVVSDTHLTPTRSRQSLDAVVDLFRRFNVDLILHAGDAGQQAVLDDLAAVAPVEAVRGNADPLDLFHALPEHVWIEAGPRTILMLHGHHGKTALKAARAAATPDIDLIVFGHSHQPLIEREGNSVLFNPGSPTERRWNPHFGVGVIDIDESAIAPELVLFDDPRHLSNVSP